MSLGGGKVELGLSRSSSGGTTSILGLPQLSTRLLLREGIEVGSTALYGPKAFRLQDTELVGDPEA